MIAEFCAGFREDDTVDLFLPSVTRCLRERDPVAYSEHLPGINRQKLHRRLWAGLKREACKYHEAGALRQAILREKGIKVRGRRQAGTNQPSQPASRPAEEATAGGLRACALLW